MTTTPIPTTDLTWLNMDVPTNLMVVNGLMWFDGEVDWAGVEKVLQERVIDVYPVMRRRPRHTVDDWVWEDDPDFDLTRHVRYASLPEPGDRAAAEDYLSGRASQPLDRNHPLWEFDFIDGYTGTASGTGSLLLARFHHSLADGIRIVQLILGLCDIDSEALPPIVGRRPSTRRRRQRLAGLAREVTGSAFSFAGDVARAAVSAVPQVPAVASDLLNPGTFNDAWALATKPTRVTDAIAALSSEENRALNSWRSASRVVLWGNSARLVADQAPGVAKRLTWLEGIDLDHVKAVGRSNGATVNDVLMASVSMGLTAYLRGRGIRVPAETTFMVPIALKPFDTSAPAELGNHFAVVILPMPLGVDDTPSVLAEVRSRMNRIKHSAEAMMFYGIQSAVAETPRTISVNLTKFVANKCVGVLTNVPGPRTPISLAGHQVAGVLGWVPTSSDQTIGICIFSYSGHVSIGIVTDAAIIPDPSRLGTLIEDALEGMYDDAAAVIVG